MMFVAAGVALTLGVLLAAFEQPLTPEGRRKVERISIATLGAAALAVTGSVSYAILT